MQRFYYKSYIFKTAKTNKLASQSLRTDKLHQINLLINSLLLKMKL